MAKKLIIANWKELPKTLGEAEEILDYLGEELNEQIAEKADVVLCPPEKYRQMVAEALGKEPLSEYVELGLQDISLVGTENFAKYVIIGHSSRRVFESDEIVNQKLKLALQKNLTPIVCIGEKVREVLPARGGSAFGWKQFLENQVRNTFIGLSADEAEKCFIAYEPVWAISTNPGAKPDSPDETRKALAVLAPLAPDSLLLYGGSVDAKNTSAFLAMPEISGVLIGGASVRKEEFLEILKQV